MPHVLPLESMTQKEKLRAMEELWDSLGREENLLKSPAWHGKVLSETACEVELGQATFSDWGVARERIRRKINRKS